MPPSPTPPSPMPTRRTRLTPGSLARLVPGSLARLAPGSLARVAPGSLARLAPVPLSTDAEGTPVVDVRGPRFGAAVTTAVLVTAVVVQGSVGLALLTWQWVAFALSAIAGLAWSPYGRVFRALKRRGHLGPPPAIEPAAGPRFAQACGLVVTTLALVLHLLGAATAGWIAAGVVLALSTLLATTGRCVGCEVLVVAERLRVRAGGRGTPRRRSAADAEVSPEHLAAVGLDLDGTDMGVLLFSGGSCAACVRVKALLDELSPEIDASGRRLRWVGVDVASHLDLAQTLRVLRVPTLVVLDPNGRVVARTSGGARLEALRAMLDDAVGDQVA